MKAVDRISFQVRAGQVVGFIGANGAGKTTTMRILATLSSADAGEVKIAGLDVMEYPAEVRRKLGWMPDQFGVYDYVSVFEYLDFYARAYGFKAQERRRRVEEVMVFTDLATLGDRPMRGLSKGQAQKLCFGRTLLHDPEILILDEPAAGLDPRARIEFKNLVRILAQRGKTILISSHILSELGEMCDAMLFIDGGRLVYQGTASELMRQSGREVGGLVEVVVTGEREKLLQWLECRPGWKLIRATREGALAAFESDQPEALAAQLRMMVGEGLPLVEFKRIERRLEDAFVDMLKNGGQA